MRDQNRMRNVLFVKSRSDISLNLKNRENGIFFLQTPQETIAMRRKRE